MSATSTYTPPIDLTRSPTGRRRRRPGGSEIITIDDDSAPMRTTTHPTPARRIPPMHQTSNPTPFSPDSFESGLSHNPSRLNIGVIVSMFYPFSGNLHSQSPPNPSRPSSTRSRREGTPHIVHESPDLVELSTPPPRKPQPEEKPPQPGHVVDLDETKILVCCECDQMLGEKLWTLKCGHIICGGCVDTSNNLKNKVCPSCGAKTRTSNLQQLYV
ncbi:6876_t:CDS:2 [Paraglomus brasilianum]|uniref:6876_t:CDS:1 n=1 Tax=Paraglomus brasilianum TaxID=144538 RepID=A0A9N8Z421_9GLOM|nr:6876_t:CDS:2 [Paraglomus brasilianum]